MDQGRTTTAAGDGVQRSSAAGDLDTSPGGLETFLQDLRFGARVLYKRPAFTLIAVLTLALGIGANTAIFSIVNAALLNPIPVPEPDRVVMVWTDKLTHGSTGFPASVPDFLDWRASGVFQELAGFTTEGFNLLIGSTPERVQGASVTKEWFEILRTKPYLGRVFQAQDMQPGHDHAVLLSYNTWHARYHADPGIIGTTVIINSAPYTVVGVLPKRIARIGDEEIYVPLVFEPPLLNDRAIRYVGTVGRLANETFAAAQARMTDVSARLEREYATVDAGNHVRLQPIEQAYIEDVHTLLMILFGAVGFVLLIACANIANLLLVRGTARQKEMAIRAALGAGRFRLTRQLLTESVLLSVLGAVAGLLPAFFGVRFLAKFRPESLPNAELIGLNPSVLLFTLGLAILTGLLFGIIPAWEAWRSSAISPLRERSQVSGRELRFGNFFVIGEVALTVILVAGAALMLRTLEQLRSANPGYDQHVLTMRIALTGKQYDSPDKQILFFHELIRRLNELPGIRAVGAIDSLPTSNDIEGGTIHFIDRPEPNPSERAIVIIGSVLPNYFQAMRIPLVRGRLFTEADTANNPLVVILDERTARRYWPNEDPIGKSIRVRIDSPLRRIVGVVGNIERNVVVKVKSQVGQVYVPYTQWPSSEMSVAIAADMGLASLAIPARRAVASLAPDQPIYQIQTMEQARIASQTSSQFTTSLLTFFAVVSVLLAAVGIYGVISYTVELRTREIGIRMALGATQGDLLWAVVKRGLYLTMVGLLIGLGGALLLTRLMGTLLHGTSATDPVSFAAAAIVLGIVSLLATYIPAYRASRVQPMIALRHE